jgi:DNA-binding response OmpR family regulator
MYKPKVLVVDDDRRYLELLEYALEGEGFQVLVVQDPLLVQDLALSTRPDVIVTDVAMPGLDGYAMAMGLRTDPQTAEIPLIFVTARGQDSQKLEVSSVGVVEYMTKPFSMEELAARIRRISSAALPQERPDVS